jgi:hypothetical protein
MEKYLYLLSKIGSIKGCVVNITPSPLYPLERDPYHLYKRQVGVRTGLDGCGKS